MEAQKILSHYELGKELGRGGMATVYEAVNLENMEPVALKVLHPNLASDPIARKRFLREARAGMELDHPAIVKVYDVGDEGGRPFITMELVDGQTLGQMMEKEPIEMDRVIEIGIKVSDALAAAHEKGIIHRDIKPGNIMVTDRTVKVMDFGLAQIVEGSLLTAKYEIVGTLNYMSPQQAIGQRVDKRSDIFSLGVVFYQLLTNTLPFEGDHPGAVIHAILHSDPLRVEEIRPGIPEDFERVLFKMLQKKPQDRYQDAGELRSDLESVKEILKGKSLELIATRDVFEESARGVYSAFIGRESELDALENHMEGMLKGEGTVLLIGGEAGIGKSRLVWELGRRAKREKVRYLVGRCLSGEGGAPYQPVFEVIRTYFELKGVKKPDKLKNFIIDRAPDLIGRIGVINAFIFMEADPETWLTNKEQLWDTATELVKIISRDKPVILHFEDLHWADHPTLNLLDYLSRNIQGEQVMVIVTYRPEDLIEEIAGRPNPVVTFLERMRREHLCEEIHLTRLEEEKTRSIILSVYPDVDFPDDFIRTIHEETEGNPLFLLEILQLIQDEGVIIRENGGWNLSGDLTSISIPGRVNDVIMNRLRCLNQEERSLVDVASVEGRSFHSDALCYCLGLKRLKVLQALQNIENSCRLIHASEREYHFDHGLIREVVYGNLIPELKVEYHRLVGEYFRENFGENDAYAGKVAHHLLEADEEVDALPYLIRAGEHARKLFANDEAIGYFDKGVELIERHFEGEPPPDFRPALLDLLKGRARVKQLIGHYDETKDDYNQIETLARDLDDRTGLADGLHGLGEISRRMGNYEDALRHFEQSLEIRRRIGDRQGEAATLINIGIYYSVRGDVERALQSYEEALKIHRQVGDRLGEGVALNNIGNIHGRRGDYKQALGYYEQSLVVKREIGDKPGEGAALNNLGNVHARHGDYARAIGFFEKSLKIRRQIGDRRGEGATLSNMGSIYSRLGEFEMGLNCLEQALLIWREIGAKEYQLETQHDLCKLWVEVGARDRACAEFEKIKGLAELLETRKMKAWLLIGSGMLELADGSHKSANLAVEKGLEIARELREVDAIMEGLVYTAQLEIGREDIQGARKIAEEVFHIALEKKRKLEIIQAHLLLSHIFFLMGEYEGAESNADRAIEMAGSCGLKPLLWQAHHRLGKVCLKKRQIAQARKEFMKAQRVVDEISSKLSNGLRETYLAKGEIEDLYNDLSRVKMGRSNEKVKKKEKGKGGKGG